MSKKMVNPAIFAGLTKEQLDKKLIHALNARTEIRNRQKVQDCQKRATHRNKYIQKRKSYESAKHESNVGNDLYPRQNQSIARIDRK
jgi:hypothetical protein